MPKIAIHIRNNLKIWRFKRKEENKSKDMYKERKRGRERKNRIANYELCT